MSLDQKVLSTLCTDRLALEAMHAKINQAALVAADDPDQAHALMLAAMEVKDDFRAVLDDKRPKYAPVKPLSSRKDVGLVDVHASPTAKPEKPGCPLNDAYLETIRLIGHGLTRQEVGQEMCLNENTVKSRLAHASKKLGVNTQAGLVGKCYREGWL